MDELTREFLIESQDGLDRMERCLTELEAHPQDGDLLADIFRSVHTIKGTTGFLGYSRLETLSHAGENLLGALRDGKVMATPEVIGELLLLLDGLRAVLGFIEAEGSEGEGGDRALIERLCDLQREDLQKPELDQGAVAVASIDRGFTETQTRRRRAKTRTPVRNRVRKPTCFEPSANPSPGVAAGAAEEGCCEPLEGTPLPKASATAAYSTLRVDVNLLNRMMNLVGELVLTRNQILRATNSDAGFTFLSRRLDMVTADLREAVMKARMQPVSHIFSKFPRLVRDLAQQLGKRVRLEMEGQETELDKSLLEAIKDPLTHAVRNSIDHGIEEPHLREAADKPAEGVLRLRAFQAASHIIIEVTDDGGGIRVEKVRDKAIERKLITAVKAAQSSDRELLQLIFLPGFSTAATVTNVSGRGVGMDVVRNNVEKIGGKVEIESRAGKGTTLRLRIPLTLAIIPALIVRSRQQSFALPQGVLHELVHLSQEQARAQIEWMEHAPLYRLRGGLLPLVFLDRLLEQKGASDGSAGYYIAVLNTDGRRFGLVVDGLADPEEIVVKPLSPVLKQIGLFSGATVMGNGEMALILDPGAVALRASIAISPEDEETAASEMTRLPNADHEFLVVETGTERSALPLRDVLRIERIPRSRIERVGRTPVLRFAGALLPLEDSSGVLQQSPGEDTQLTVVVCHDGARQVGVAVSHVLDVAVGEPLAEAGTGDAAAGVTLLNERVTNVVDLSRIAPLPVPPTDVLMEVAG